jgi:hypothetical protein
MSHSTLWLAILDASLSSCQKLWGICGVRSRYGEGIIFLSVFVFWFNPFSSFFLLLIFSLLLKPAKAARLQELLEKNPEASIAQQNITYNDFEDSSETSSDSDDDDDDSSSIGSQTSSSNSDLDDDHIDGLVRHNPAFHQQLVENQRATRGINAQPKKEEVAVDETKVVMIQEMGFNVDRKTIVQCLRIDGTVETAVAAIISNM